MTFDPKWPERPRSGIAAVLAAAALLLAPLPAAAYGGPGSVISGIGALIAAVAALAAALFGFVWFPVKRLLRAIRGEESEEEATDADAREAPRSG